ncbi:MAG: hypothetical protein HY460_00925, partial [Parcubacteria group bacterium]|nr:hypothetical protein [Parcubacteria group bacterium]
MWFLFALLGHSVNALTFLMDRYVLHRTIFNPLASLFTVSLMAIPAVALLLLPLGIPALPAVSILLSIASGLAFLCGIFLFYHAMVANEASRVAPLTGSFVPLFTAFFANQFGREDLMAHEWYAFAFLVGGGFIIAWDFTRRGFLIQGFWFSLGAAFFIALSFSLAKNVFDIEPPRGDVASFLWARLAGLLLIPFFFIIPALRRRISGMKENLSLRDTLLF